MLCFASTTPSHRSCRGQPRILDGCLSHASFAWGRCASPGFLSWAGSTIHFHLAFARTCVVLHAPCTSVGTPILPWPCRSRRGAFVSFSVSCSCLGVCIDSPGLDVLDRSKVPFPLLPPTAPYTPSRSPHRSPLLSGRPGGIRPRTLYRVSPSRPSGAEGGGGVETKGDPTLGSIRFRPHPTRHPHRIERDEAVLREREGRGREKGWWGILGTETDANPT